MSYSSEQWLTFKLYRFHNIYLESCFNLFFNLFSLYRLESSIQWTESVKSAKSFDKNLSPKYSLYLIPMGREMYHRKYYCINNLLVIDFKQNFFFIIYYRMEQSWSLPLRMQVVLAYIFLIKEPLSFFQTVFYCPLM